MTEITTLSEFFTPTIGEEEGHCIICSRETTKGHPIDFSPNFMGWVNLYEGDCICEYCYSLCRNQQYRKRAWAVSNKGVHILKREEIISILLNPPSPPFGIYLTKTYKKQGFMKLIHKVNYNRDHYFIAFDDDVIYVEREIITPMIQFATKLRENNLNKSEMISGNVKIRNYSKLNIEDIDLLKSFAGMPMWKVVVYAIK